ncbi:dephospho-CoA kinase [Mycetocola reblochoni]|nr:dephospho-CoA kinase [Mycetocola reblochoni]
MLIGLTGGIAAGKSTVARRLATLGAVVIDADVVAREVVEPGTDALSRIREHFGPAVLAADGSLDRAALGAIVFSDDDARAELNAIVHPAVRRRTAELITAATGSDPDAVVVYDVPLLVEAAVPHEFDLVVVVEASAEARVRRLVENRGLSREQAQARVAAQASDAERRAVADVVLNTEGTEAQTLAQTDQLWRERIRPRSFPSRHRP